MEYQHPEVRAKYDGRKMRKKLTCESVEGPPVGVHLVDLPADGCRHVYGGVGTGIKFCGIPTTRKGITYVCEIHRYSYVREKFVPQEERAA